MKVGRRELREMLIGETKEFRGVSPVEMESACTCAYNLQRIDGVKYQIKRDFANQVLIVKKGVQ